MLYARIFVKILDSSIAENWQARHVFEDMLKLADDGVLDVTRQAIARRTNVPLDIINEAIAVLESPDPASRDPEDDGRRIVRLDETRDWGWRIVNWEKYEAIRSTADQREKTRQRMIRLRQRRVGELSPRPPTKTKTTSEAEDTSPKRTGRHGCVTPPAAKPQQHRATAPPTLDELKLQAAKIGLPDNEAEKFFNYYESNGWRVGKNPMRSWSAALTNWKLNAKKYENHSKPNPRNAGVAKDVSVQGAETVAFLARQKATRESV